MSLDLCLEADSTLTISTLSKAVANAGAWEIEVAGNGLYAEFTSGLKLSTNDVLDAPTIYAENTMGIDFPVAVRCTIRIQVSAIEAFDRWEQPWEFYESVSSAPSLDADDLEKLRRTWGTAIERGGWLASKDFADGCSLADARLASGFPWLSNKARRQLVTAASYQWL